MPKKVRKPLTLEDYYDYREGKKYSNKNSAKHRAFKLMDKLLTFPAPLRDAWGRYFRTEREAMLNALYDALRKAKKENKF